MAMKDVVYFIWCITGINMFQVCLDVCTLLLCASYLLDRISVEDLQQSGKRDSGFLL